jgi:hypothetical protein
MVMACPWDINKHEAQVGTDQLKRRRSVVVRKNRLKFAWIEIAG